MYKKKWFSVFSLVILAAMILSACGGAAPAEDEGPANPGLDMDAAAVALQFWSDELYDESVEFMGADPINPEAPVYLQSLIRHTTSASRTQV